MYIIRPFTPADLPLMEEFLYQAIFQRPGTPVIPRSELEKPSIRVYIDRFGEYPDDHCLCAELDGAVVGMVWVRNIKGFGSIDETTPEFAISLLPDARGKGIGTALMRAMLKLLREKGYPQTSLAVQKDNYAVKMYKSVGFAVIGENDQEYIMLCDLRKDDFLC